VRPGMMRRMDRSRALAMAAFAAWAFVGGAIVAPLLETAHHEAGAWLGALYAPLCHQLPERSFAIAGHPVALCARCVGGSVGAALGLSLTFFGLARLRGDRRAWLALAALPVILDVGARWYGAAGAGNALRAALTLPLGLVAGALLAEGIVDLAGRPVRSLLVVQGRIR
jgi:uncharacterized membrane protein